MWVACWWRLAGVATDWVVGEVALSFFEIFDRDEWEEAKVWEVGCFGGG